MGCDSSQPFYFRYYPSKKFMDKQLSINNIDIIISYYKYKMYIIWNAYILFPVHW